MKSLTIELPRAGMVLKPKFSDQNFSLLMMQIILPGEEYRSLMEKIQRDHVFPQEVEGITKFVDRIRETAETGKDDLVEEVMLDPVLGRYDEPEYRSNLAIELCKYFPSLAEEGYLSYKPGNINLDVEDISAIVLALLTEFLRDMFGAAEEKLKEEEVKEKVPVGAIVKEKEKVTKEKETIAPRMGISPSEPTDEEIILAYRSQVAKQLQSAPVIPQMYPPNLKAIAQSNMDDPFEV